MGLFDSVKSRLGFGNADARNQDWHEREYQEEYYDRGGRGEPDEPAYDDYEGQERPAGMRAFGVDRADYYNDNHAPFISQSDVRSRPLLRDAPAEQDFGRGPAPVVRQRAPLPAGRPASADDINAFKTGLARSPNSLTQLHDQRLRLEDSGKIVPLGVGAGAGYGAGSSREITDELGMTGGGAYGGAGGYGGLPAGAGGGRGGGGAMGAGPRTQIHRRVEHIHPITYADAEQISLELKKGSVVVLDLRTTRPDLAKRILDFAFGVASALEGQVERHIDRVYLFTRNGPIHEEERATIRL